MTPEDHFERQLISKVVRRLYTLGVAPSLIMCLADSYKPSFTSVTGGHTRSRFPPAFGENPWGKRTDAFDTEAGGLSRLVKSIEAKVQEQ